MIHYQKNALINKSGIFDSTNISINHNLSYQYRIQSNKCTLIVVQWLFRSNKKVFWVTGLKILGRVGTHIFF